MNHANNIYPTKKMKVLKKQDALLQKSQELTEKRKSFWSMTGIFQSRARIAGLKVGVSGRRLNILLYRYKYPGRKNRPIQPKRKLNFPETSDRPAPPAPPPPKREFEIIDSVYACPLSVYIDVTVDDRMDGLIISGRPTHDELEEAKMKLVSEFTELSGGGEMKAT